MEPPISCLLDLAPDLVEAIAFALRPSLKTLGALSQVCRSLHLISVPVLYKSVALRSRQSTSHFSWTITHSPHLIPLVRELQVHYHDLDQGTDDCPEDIDPLLAKLVNLESLTVRANWFDWGKALTTSLIRDPQRALPALRFCNLGCDYEKEFSWPLDPYESLLYHPGLETLTITGAQVQTRWRYLPAQPPPPRSTHLQELRLLNCDLASRSIAEMLQYPRGLKHFTLKGEAAESTIGPFRGADRSEYIDALRPHSSTLETLDLDFLVDWEQPINLSAFTALRSLTIAPRILVGDDPDGRANLATTSRWRELLPSSIKHLEFRSHEAIFPIAEIYDLVRHGDLHLSSFTCQMLSNTPEGFVSRSPGELLSEDRSIGKSFSRGFEELGVQFSVVEVSDSQRMPESDACPCECWIYKHRLDPVPMW